MKSTPNKKPPVKARKLYSYPHEDCYVVTDVPPMARDVKAGWCNPVFVLPASREAYLKLVQQMACAMYKRWQGGNGKHFCGRNAEDAEAALKSIGIHPLTK